MGVDYFTKKPFKDRLKDTLFLIKNSFNIIRKDKDIKIPTIHMILLSITITVFVFGALLTFFLGKLVSVGFLLFAIVIFILTPFKYFYNVRQKANQSWIVYNTICGRNISYSEAHEHTKSEKGKLRIIALIDILMNFANSQRQNKKGVIGFLISIFLSFLDEIWDLVSHYVLPAIVIEQQPLKKIIPEIKSLKNNVPATLVGVFGIDFVGNVIRSLSKGLMFITLILSIGIGYLVAMFTTNHLITIGNIQISWIPIFILIFLESVISRTYNIIIESIKVIYFTIFYTSITRPMDISENLRDELTNYLLMKKSDFIPREKPDPKQQYIVKLSEYFKQYETKGYSKEQIKQFLISKGHSEKDIDLAINNMK